MNRHAERPIPAAIDGRRWSVKPSQHLTGSTETRRAEMYAPLVDTPTARMIRAHEMIHARITPRVSASAAASAAGCTIEALQWAEDWRVNRLAGRKGLVDDDALTDAEADMIAGACSGSERMIAGAMLCHLALPAQRAQIVNAMMRAGVPFDTLQDIRRRVKACADGALAGLSRGRRRRRSRTPVCLSRPQGFARFTKPLARLFDAEFPVAPPPGDRRDGRDDGPRVDRELRSIAGAVEWAPVTDVHRLPMPRAVKPRMPIGRRFSDAGVIPTAPHRLPTDGTIFGVRRRGKGGTVLCDASGSMHYDDADVERILREAPGSTIAFYSGDRDSDFRPHGRIVIGAERGRAATVEAIMEALPGQENFIDGPALRWLARQPGPRFWISDEGVGGVHDFGRGSDSHAECLAICRAAGIRIVPRIEALKR